MTLNLELVDDYPTEDTLRQVREAPAFTREDCAALLAAVREVWAYGAAEPEGDVYTLATGGWSGNEDIIGALQDNRIFWIRCWESSRRGGQFEFRLPEAT